jgi:hypothetical protein
VYESGTLLANYVAGTGRSPFRLSLLLGHTGEEKYSRRKWPLAALWKRPAIKALFGLQKRLGKLPFQALNDFRS